MTRVLHRFSVVVVLTLSLVSQPLMARGAPDSFAPLVEKLLPAVVNVSTSQKLKDGGPTMLLPFGNVPDQQLEEFKEFFEKFGGGPFGAPGGMGGREVQSLGSGFVIDPDGYIVTNNHVVDGADEISVRFTDDTTYDATLVGRDPKTDLALLKIEAKKKLPYVEFGDSDDVRVGDWVIAIGNPYGLGGSVSAGIISARSRNINAGPFDDFLQTDAAINRGNSGGPMFDQDGRVIGVNTAIFSPTGGNVGIGFAVPATLAKPVLEQLREFGRTHRGWLGVKIQTVSDEIAESVGLDDDRGALVLEVTPDSPASKAGIKAGDVILSFDRRAIKEMRFLPRIVAETEIGKQVDVEVWRGEKRQTLNVTLGELDETAEFAEADADLPNRKAGDIKGEDFLGMTLATIDPALRRRFALEKDQNGIIVLEVDSTSSASERGIRSGDVILAVGQRPVVAVEVFKQEVARAKRDGKKYILVRVQRGDEASFVTLPTEEAAE